jgi:hypothetical protein
MSTNRNTQAGPLLKLSPKERYSQRIDLTRKAAKEYRQRGWKPIPIDDGKKHPTIVDWQLIDDHRFGPGHLNIGLQLGGVSKGLTDVDLDCELARQMAPDFLPPTNAVFGRKSSPKAHWLYLTDIWNDAKTAAIGFDDPIKAKAPAEGEHGCRLVEIRSGAVSKDGKPKGACSMAPPSIHPSGERVLWDCDGEPEQVSAAELRQRVAELAAAVLLVTYYPRGGNRQGAALVLGGWLARAGWSADLIDWFVGTVARHAGDEEGQKRAKSAAGAPDRLASGEPTSGKPKMIKLFGAEVVDALAEWLDPTSTDNDAVANNAIPYEAPEPRSIDEVLKTFQHWLKLEDATPLYAMLGTIAANMLPGDPVWLGIIAPPSSAKTEILTTTARLPDIVQAATLTLGALLSGTPQKQRAKGAKGGLLRLIGDFGILVVKDFSSILSMRPDVRGEVLAALREIYDGKWVRHLGTDGGRTLEWSGKMGLLFAATEVIDQHYAVIGAMGDRWMLCRLRLDRSGKGQLRRALEHKGKSTQTMRDELADAVAGLFAAERREPRDLNAKEENQLDLLCRLVVRLRGHVERDRMGKDIIAVHGAEGTPRLGLMLERLLAGLDTLGVEREAAFKVVESIAYDSVPPQRLKAYRYLRYCKGEVPTTKVAAALGLPTKTTRWRLEELAAHGVVKRIVQGQGHPDLWSAAAWGGLKRE